MTITLVLAVGVTAFIVLYMMNSLDDKKHWVLKLVMLIFSATLLLILPKIGIDSLTTCEPVINTIESIGGFQNYTYTNHCITSSVSTGISFLKTSQLLYYILLAYSIVAIAIWSMFKLADSVKKRGNR